MGHNGCDGSQASRPWAIGSGYCFTTEPPHPRRPHPGRTGANCPSEDPIPGWPGRGSAQCRTPLALVRGLAARPTSGRPQEGERLTPDAPCSRAGTRPQWGQERDTQRSPGGQRSAPARGGVRCEANARLPQPHPTTPTAHAAERAATGAGQPLELHTPSPALKHSNTAMTEPTAPRKMRPRSRTLDAAHEVIRAPGLRGSDEDPLPQGTRKRIRH